MPTPAQQMPSLVLPAVWIVDTEVENIDDLLEYTSISIDVEELQEKRIHVIATEVVGVGAPGNLWCWIELSPSAAAGTWGAIGGGGGALVPIAPVIEAGVGVNGTVHNILIPWAIHSMFARVVVQTPVNAGLPDDWWTVQCWISGKGP